MENHQHNSSSFFEELLQNAPGRLSTNEVNHSFVELTSDSQLSDHVQNEESGRRSRMISDILGQYSFAYKKKIRFQRCYRHILFWGCSLVVLVFLIAVIFVLKYAICNVGTLELSGVATMITSVISLIVAILELVKIITKYCFPENDEEYIVQIVKSIQENDLENTKERNRFSEVRSKHESNQP